MIMLITVLKLLDQLWPKSIVILLESTIKYLGGLLLEKEEQGDLNKSPFS